MFLKFPYTDTHQLNLDWIVKKIQTIPTKLSELANDVGFITRQQAPVQSVNGQTGDVIVSGTGAVDSVNGKIGNVVLTAADVGAKPDSYTAPVDSVNGLTGAVQLDIPDDTADLTNSAGFVNAVQAAAAAPVQSVNGQTGAVIVSGSGAVDSVNGQTGVVVLTASDVGAKPASYNAPVDSVNGQTGAVVLSAADVGAKPASYAAPVDSVNGLTGAVVVNRVTSLTLPASWTGTSSPYTQTVTISGTTSNSKIDLQPDATAIQQMISDNCTALYIVNNAGTLTAYAVGGKPSAALTIQAMITEVSQ